MNEMILELIFNQIEVLVLYSFFSVMGIVAIVLLLTFYEFNNASMKYRNLSVFIGFVYDSDIGCRSKNRFNL